MGIFVSSYFNEPEVSLDYEGYKELVLELSVMFEKQYNGAVRSGWISSFYKNQRGNTSFVFYRGNVKKGIEDEFSKVKSHFEVNSTLNDGEASLLYLVMNDLRVDLKRAEEVIKYVRGTDLKLAAILSDKSQLEIQDILSDAGVPQPVISLVKGYVREVNKVINTSDSILRGADEDKEVGKLFINDKAKVLDVFMAVVIGAGVVAFAKSFDVNFNLYDALKGGTEKARVGRVFLSREEALASASRSYKYLAPNALVNHPNLRKNIFETLQDAARRGVRTATNQTLALFGQPAIKEVVLASKYKSFIKNRIKNLVKGLDQNTKKIMANSLVKGVEMGWSRSRIQKELLKDIPALAVARAKTIVHTETTAIYSYMAEKTAVMNGLKDKVWITMGDNKVCPFCESNQAQGTVPLNEVFSSGNVQPPAHPNCRCVVEYSSGQSAFYKAKNLLVVSNIDQKYVPNPYAIYNGSRYVGRDEDINYFIQYFNKASDLREFVETDGEGEMLIDKKAKVIKLRYQSVGNQVWNLRNSLEKLYGFTATQYEWKIIQARVVLSDYGFLQILSNLNLEKAFVPLHPELLIKQVSTGVKHKKKKDFPDLVGMSEVDAEKELANLGLKKVEGGYSAKTLLALASVRMDFIPDKYKITK
jgi:SPP1 gp7 family putative phage head morphogenesis protein